MLGTNRLSAIAALGKDRAIGSKSQLLWNLPEDLKRFKTLTTGHPVIMGRKTWESIPPKFRPLPGRTNIVITKNNAYEAPGAVIANSFESARATAEQAAGAEETFVIGGGEIYEEALPHVSRLYLTLVDDDKDGDTFFPSYEEEFTKVISEEVGEGEPLHRFVTLERN